MTIDMNEDAIVACADLVFRAGAEAFEIGYLHDDVPVEESSWYASAIYRGARVIAEEHRSPTTAALDLAERILRGGMCKCRQPVALADGTPGCRWTLAGKRWQPSCDAEPIHVTDADRGDLAALQRAVAGTANRAGRRAAKRKGGA